MEVASRNLTAVHLELGGKSPVIVFADADMSQAIPWAMMAARPFPAFPSPMR